MQKTEFLTVLVSYANLDAVKRTLPSVIAETTANDARLIVHGSTEAQHGQTEKWAYLQELAAQSNFFLILSTI